MKAALGWALAAGAGVWGLFENTAVLSVARYETDFTIGRVLQISDWHDRASGSGRLISRAAKLRPTMIAVTGDLVSRGTRDFSRVAKLLSALCEIAPVYVIFGNHELDLPRREQLRLRRVILDSGAVLLDDEIIKLDGFFLAGLTLSRENYRGGGLFGFRPKTRPDAKEIEKALGVCPEGTLLLAHNPAYFEAYARWGARLTLSGHNHGGAVRLPVLGGLLSPERVFFPRYDRGKFSRAGKEMIVSAGLGKARFNNPPEICLIRGKKKERKTETL